MKQFDVFRLDTVNHCLWRQQERVPLAPKAFDVLRYLVEHSDRLVTQDEILEALWPATYVNPEVVKKYILGIRKSLGDQSSKPTFVQTFPRRGYQFIAPVRDDASTPSTASTNGHKTIVGRESALAQLDDAFRSALQGQRQIVFITGEAGIGKTTLVDVFHQQAAFGANTRIARGQCVEGFGGKEAYYPVLDAFGPLLKGPDGPSMVNAFLKQAPTWLVQFPSALNTEQREALQKEILGATRERMVREICEALEAVTEKNPLVLCLEDLHWVDPSTLDFISALARRRGPAKLLLLATYRPADVIISQSPLKALKQDLLVHNLSREVSLERLEESDVAEYLSIKFGDESVPAGLANLVYRHSGGNALFMETILQDMLKQGLIASTAGKWRLAVSLDTIEPIVPETLDQLIEIQFQQLNAVEQRILKSASVAGERFSVWAIATAAELEPSSIEDVCEGLVERLQFIKADGLRQLPNGQNSAHYEFLHSLYREVLYRRLSEVSRSKLHGLLAQRLQALGAPSEQELASELAVHFEGGRDYEQAIRYLILAAENAAKRFAYRDSIEILRHALQLVAKINQALQPALEIQLLEFVGDAQFALGALVESAESYEVAAARAGQAGLRSDQVRILNRSMWPLGFIDPDHGIAALGRALRTSMNSGDPVLLGRTQLLATGCRLIFDVWSQRDVDLCASARETLRRLGDAGMGSYEQICYSHVLTLRGRYREALRIFDSGISPTDHGINLIAHFGALSLKTLALLRLGQLGEVLRIIRVERELSKENLALAWLLSVQEAWVRTLIFDFAGAQRVCETFREAGAELPPGPQTITQMAAGHVEFDRREYARAIELFSQVRDPKVPRKFFLRWVWRMTAQLELGNVWLLSGNVSKARAEADALLDSALTTADPHLQALAWELIARVAIAENHWSAAQEAIQQALAIVDKFEILVAAWQVHASAWQIYAHFKDRKRAQDHRDQAKTCILAIANSFPPDEPLRSSFLCAPRVARILSATSNQAAAR